VIIALHHEQDMRRMGGLRKYMPVTYLCVFIGALANAGLPPFAGFFSKDSIIEAVKLSHTFGAGFAWLMVLAGVFVGGFYSFRLVFYAFHGKPRFDSHGHPPHESPLVVTVPLVLLAIPSVVSGWVIGEVVFGGYFGGAIVVADAHAAVKEMAGEFHGIVPMMLHGLTQAPFWLALAGAAVAWVLYIARPEMAGIVRSKAGILVRILEDKYGFDRFNDWFFAGGARKFGTGLWRYGDVTVIDGLMVNGSARLVGWFAGVVRWLQSGYIYHYAFVMIIGVSVLLTWFIFFGGSLVR
jgi:NADH-quinone oxidoreductase subunit L